VFDSVRVRLTLWHVGVLALLLVSFSTGLYVLLRQNFYERADGILKSVCTATVSILGKELSESGLDELAARDAVKTLNFSEHTLAIFDSQGGLLAEKPVGSSTRVALPAAESLQDGAIHLLTLRSVGEERRVAAVRVTLEPVGRTYTVVTSRSLTPLLGELAADRLVLSLAIPLALLLAAVGGWFLARKSLSPVMSLSEQALHIGATNLDQRLTVANPHDELGKLASAFNDLLSRLHSAFAMQRQFMADASHELRTPVSVLRTTGAVIMDQPHRTEDEYRSALAIVDEQSQRLARIVEDLFSLARADAGYLALQKHSFFLDDVLMETTRAGRILGASKNIGVALSQVLSESPCVGDEDLLRQMITNLLHNAVKYTPPGGSVTVELNRRDAAYAISVTDTGPGIPLDAQAHIFERFFRAEKTRSRASEPNPGGGAGLGLAIARAIAEAHGGTLLLERSDERGSTFVAIVPLQVSAE
jgi:two-component system OmpR family sensor kinase